MMGATPNANFDDYVSTRASRERAIRTKVLYGSTLRTAIRGRRADGVPASCPSQARRVAKMARARWVRASCSRTTRLATVPSTRASNDDAVAEEDEPRSSRSEVPDEWEGCSPTTMSPVVPRREGCRRGLSTVPSTCAENGFVTEVEHLRFGPHWRNRRARETSRTAARHGGGRARASTQRPILSELGYSNPEIEDPLRAKRRRVGTR